MPIRTATSRSVSTAIPLIRATSQAAARISCRVASRRSARLSRLGIPTMVRNCPPRSAVVSRGTALPAQFVQASVVDAEVVSDLVHDGGAHLTHDIVLGITDRENRLTE